MYGLPDEYCRELSTRENFHLLQNGIAAKTSKAVLNAICDRLISLRAESLSIQDPDDSPAANTRSRRASSNPIQIFSNVIGAKLPDETTWKQSYFADSQCRLILDIIENPSLATKTNIERLHYSLRSPMRRKLVLVERGMIIIKEPIKGECAFRRLQLVPRDLRQIVFIAFHANPDSDL